MTASPYPWLMILGIGITVAFWVRLARRDERLFVVYIAALIGAFAGAKLVYLAAEGWMYWSSPDRWMIWATGKSILGALLGGYVAVECAKKLTGYSRATGDWFALVAPFGIVLGRIGCLLHGCCLGQPCPEAWWTIRDAMGQSRWPAVPVEIAFNLLAMVLFFLLRRRHLFAGQHFHLYLLGYGTFRFVHEFFRDTPRWAGGMTGYQYTAIAVAMLGIVGFVRRRHAQRPSPGQPATSS